MDTNTDICWQALHISLSRLSYKEKSRNSFVTFVFLLFVWCDLPWITVMINDWSSRQSKIFRIGHGGVGSWFKCLISSNDVDRGRWKLMDRDQMVKEMVDKDYKEQFNSN